MRLKLICAVLVGLLLVIAPGCGSKKKAAVTTTTPATTSQSTTTNPAGLNLTSKDCANLIAAEQTVAHASSGKVPSDINAQIANLKALAKVAPAAVKSDFETLASAAEQFVKIGLKPNTSPTPAQLQQLMKLPLAKLAAAGQHLSVWAQKACAGK